MKTASWPITIMGIVLACTVITAAQAARLTPEEEIARIDALRADIAARGHSFRVAPNSLTDIPWEEFQERYLGLRLPEGLEPRPVINDHGINDRDLPVQWDWREHGGVPGMRHQGACGSCWCFSAAGAFESAIMLAEGFEVDISEQYALVCNTGGSGCGGGWMSDAYDVWQSYGAIAEEDMPYEADDTIPCPGSAYPPIAMMGAEHDAGYSVSQIKNAIYDHGPVSVTMMVYPDIVAYEGGCYEHSCYDQLNHAVGLVGWDDTYCDGQGAWIMKNSWGDDWGIGGYAYIQYDAACIGGYATYPDYIPIADLLGVNHAPLTNTENTTVPYEVLVEIISTGGSVDLGASYVAYRVNNGDWIQDSFVPTGNPDEYRVFIPAQSAGTKVEYYLHAEDTVGNSKTVPMWAPEETHIFVVGAFDLIVLEDFEEESGWIVGAPGDDATSGIWERSDPQATSDDGWIVQPEDDHTPSPGRYCFVTDGRAGTGAGTYDVDGGRTTLLSPVYDLHEYALVVVDYRRWYTNRRGANPYDDIWEVSVRSGGAEWVPIEYTTSCRENWSHQVHILNDFIEPDAETQFRFVASDEGDGSLVEALLDDFELRGIPGSSGVPADVARAHAKPLLRTSPNPFHARTTLAFRLPRSGPATLRILDCAGRLVRNLHAGETDAGLHQLTWDGRDDQDRRVAAGVYLARVTANGASDQETILLVR